MDEITSEHIAAVKQLLSKQLNSADSQPSEEEIEFLAELSNWIDDGRIKIDSDLQSIFDIISDRYPTAASRIEWPAIRDHHCLDVRSEFKTPSVHCDDLSEAMRRKREVIRQWFVENGIHSESKANVADGFEKFALAELFIQLPGNWKFKSADPRWSWPLKWLHRIAKYPHDNNASLAGPVTIIANNDPPEPLGPNTELTSLMLFAEKSFQRSDGETVHLFRISPIHSDERELEMKKGAAALMRAFDRNNVPFVVDLQRPSVVTGV